MATLEKLPQVKQMTKQLVACLIIHTSKKMLISIDQTKQQALDADPKTIQQINFTGNLEPTRNTTMFSIIKEVKETISDFSQLSKCCKRVLSILFGILFWY